MLSSMPANACVSKFESFVLDLKVVALPKSSVLTHKTRPDRNEERDNHMHGDPLTLRNRPPRRGHKFRCLLFMKGIWAVQDLPYLAGGSQLHPKSA